MFRVTLGVAAGSIAALAAFASAWPQFRGPNHSYDTGASNLPETWSVTENVRWATPVEGRGWASPIVADGKVFVATAIQEVAGKDTAPPANYRSERVGKESVFRWEVHCLDLETGEPQWKQVAHRGNPRVRTHPSNTYASETPATDGERLFVYFGMIGLFCYDLDGNELWKKDFGGYDMLGDWGTASSPIVYEGKVYLQIDNETASFVTALDAKTGDEVWRVDRSAGSSWSTPMIWRNRVRTELICNAEDVRSYHPETGESFWSLRYPGGRASASATGNDDLLVVGNERRNDGGGVMYAIKAGASGDITPAEGSAASDGVLWFLDEGGPEFASPLIYEDVVYVFGRNRGSVGRYDPATGHQLSGLERIPDAKSFWSSPWGFAGKVFCTDEAGTTHVITCGDDAKVVGANALGEEVRASPAILDGAIILRTEHKVYCIAE